MTLIKGGNEDYSRGTAAMEVLQWGERSGSTLNTARMWRFIVKEQAGSQWKEVY